MPEREEAGTVRSVERALAILDLLGQHQALGLEELHYLTELPKATVSRLLHTLLEQGWLYRGLTDRRYRLRSTRLYGDAAERFRCQVVERSAPLLVELSERTGLVADLSILDGDRLLVAESSVPGVLRKRYPANRLVVGQHASLFHSAMGKACLGELADSEVRRLARQHQVDEDLWLRTREQAHGQGYGERTEGHWEYPVRLPFLIRAVALPVRAQVACSAAWRCTGRATRIASNGCAAGTWEPWPIPSVSCSTRSTDAGVCLLPGGRFKVAPDAKGARMHKLICLGLALLALPVQAAWYLDYESSRLSFISTKNATLSEVGRFLVMHGKVDDKGQARLRVELDSVSTDIPLRDERIREHLFETKRFAEAEITAQLDLAPIAELADGVQLEMRQPVTVSLHGKRKSYASDLLVTRLDEHRFQVVTLSPLVLDAADFDLAPGIETLRKLAGAGSIGLSVPVGAVLIFTSR